MATLQLQTVAQLAMEFPPPGWEPVFKEARPELELVSSILEKLGSFFPEKHKIFRALELCPLSNVKMVILGQDPYHATDNGRPQANGMAFSTDRGHPIQPSLGNIYAELEREYMEGANKAIGEYIMKRDHLRTHYRLGIETEENHALRMATGMEEEQLILFMSLADRQIQAYVQENFPRFNRPNHGDLTKWAEQGVLLLNTCLTVTPHKAGSHKQIWNGVITRILDSINEVNPECIFLLWGRKAQDVRHKLGQRTIQLIASHPSPFSAHKASRDAPAFIGCGHFIAANEWLIKQGKTPIDWRLD